MTAPEREQLRLSLLRFLDSNPTQFGLNLALLVQMAKAEGRPKLTREETVLEIQYLVDKGFVQVLPKPLSPELPVWRITAEGRDYFAQITGD